MAKIMKDLIERAGRHLTRKQIRDLTYCPECEAGVGALCIDDAGTGETRVKNHAARCNQAYFHVLVEQQRAEQAPRTEWPA